MSTLTVQNIQGSASSSNTINVASGHKIDGASGSIVIPGLVIQTISVTGTTTGSTTSTNPVELGVEAAITPQFATSKIAVWMGVTCRWPHGDAGFLALHRKIGGGSYSSVKQFSRHTCYRNHDTSSTHGQFINFNYLDSPNTTSEITYSFATSRFTSGTMYVNPNNASGDSQNWTLMEIAQ